jgi:hypothetical protein
MKLFYSTSVQPLRRRKKTLSPFIIYLQIQKSSIFEIDFKSMHKKTFIITSNAIPMHLLNARVDFKGRLIINKIKQ